MLHWDNDAMRRRQYDFAIKKGLALEIVGFVWVELWKDTIFVLELDSLQKQKDSIKFITREYNEWLFANTLHHH